MHNIALTGLMRSGKDTVGAYLVSKGYHRMAFGTGIGEVIEKYFPEDWAKGKPRKHYQTIGQGMRELDENVWVNYVFNSMPQDKPIVITDMRQLNEAQKVREKGFIVIKVVSEKETRLDRMQALGDTVSPDNLTHDTEIQADQILPDYVVYNDATLDELYTQVDSILEYIHRRA